MTNGAEHWTRTIHGMREGLTAMRGKRDALLAEYEMAVDDCAAIERAIEAMQRLPSAAATAPLTAASFDGCRTMHEKLVRMAESWGGTVSAHDAADLLIGLGLSGSARDNLVPALQKHMADREDLWEYTGPRTYRYLPYHRNGHGNVSGGAKSGPE